MKHGSHSTRRSCLMAIRTIMAIASLVIPLEQTCAFQATKSKPAGPGWVMAEVVSEGALIHQSPNDASYVTDEAHRGDMIWIREIAPESEWVRIRPIRGSLSWILESDISEVRTGEGKVRVAQTRIRPGRAGARLPGPPGVDLKSGTTVWLLPREPLVIPQRQGLQNWRAIEPPSIEPRFVRRDTLRLVTDKKEPEVDGFVASKGPGILASVDEPPAESPEDRSVAEIPRQARPRQSTGMPEEPPDSREPSRPAEDLARENAPKKLEILDIPESLTAPASTPERMPPPSGIDLDSGIEKFADIGTEASARPTGPVSALELPADPDSALDTLESRFRVLMSEPLISWDFRPVLLACETLSTRELTATQAGRLNRLKTIVERQEEIGRSSREFWNSMRRSRSHDPGGRNEAASVTTRKTPRFDISGLLLPSRRDVDGHLLYNLIGETGLTIAYLKMPPAAPVEKWLGKKVGIRGRVRYHEDLRGRLVTVQDVELLEPESP